MTIIAGTPTAVITMSGIRPMVARAPNRYQE
ncbi:hypothetical protein HacjB3_16371 (plasmid) [Halalkalicoccus jeotgali B3]|uniref:Uncharacterized protein n=1 Tax=Halalkalicoccus jeotgali (strain DSM 18796 / CECT 7217 / JCM 14584 / KCTC 4019 / B3) TaxID=795797 RepID=D8JBH7_HALJB|nr:hypothetical protein HacjB3_16371 [Halalkalicoccus jeotgali B3]